MKTSGDLFALLRDGGEMGRLMASMDWSNTPLGPPETWPPALVTALSICLSSRFPIAIWWGPESALLYNDLYRPIAGDKHPLALGQAGREAWAEVWDGLCPILTKVRETGEGFFTDDAPFVLRRFGYAEECYFSYAFSPIRGGEGNIDGLFNIATETTYRVLSERRTKLLAELAVRMASAESAQIACAVAAECMAGDPADVPFALFYLADQQTRQAHLAGASGLSAAHPACPSVIRLAPDARNDDRWHVARVAETGKPTPIDDLDTRFGAFSGAAWPEPVREAWALPITVRGQSGTAGVLVIGVSPRRALDEGYRNFWDLLTRHVAEAISNARAYEEETKRAEALAAIARAKTAFFSNVSHEFRTPLTLMLGPLEDALSNSAHPVHDQVRGPLSIARRNCLRLLKLVNTLLDFSRIEAGGSQALYEPTDLASLTTYLASAFSSATEKAGLELVVECASLPQPIYVDRDMWEKITLNLLSNAFKFTLRGRITVRQRLVDDHVELSVEDTGCGIPASELDNVFKRFYRVEGTAGRTYEGTGIGLSLVHELVKLHGGRIRVASAEHGSTFTVSIPCGKAHLPEGQLGAERALEAGHRADPYLQEALGWLPAPAEEVVTRFLSEPPGVALAARPRVVVADDNADMRQYVRALLGTTLDVIVVPDGEAAWTAINERRPDLVITDVMMPKLDGFGLLARIRANASTRSLPVIMLSARAGDESPIEGLDAGADDYLIKPFSARELNARVRTNLRVGQIGRLLEETNDALREAQAIAHLGSWVWDVAANRVTWSDELYRIYRLERHEFVATIEGCLRLMPPEDRDVAREHIERAYHESATFGFEHRILCGDGQVRILHSRGRVLRDDKGKATRMSGTAEDITDRKLAEDRLRELASHDTLTHLPNRRLFHDRLAQAISRSPWHDRVVGVLFIDLDGFKTINDTLGHDMGDRLLIEVARRLSLGVREGDTVARLGGDEFVVILADVARVEDLPVVATKIVALLGAPFQFDSDELSVTASIGISSFPKDGKSVELLLQHADAAMYLAKQNGKNRYQHYS